MKKKRILLTGDDGYNSLGTRLLVHFLKDNYDLAIAATKDQQTGVGGHGKFKDGGKWGEADVDGVRALWVDSYPLDAVEVAQGFFKEKFDFVVSGINWGANLGGSIVSSGTFAAGWRALFLQLAPKVLAISWYTPSSTWYYQHNSQDSLSELLDYPGAVAAKVVELTIKDNLWGAAMVNINLPAECSTKACFTKFFPDHTRYFVYPNIIDSDKHTFTYLFAEQKRINAGKEYDLGAIRNGYISITPCQSSPFDGTVYQKMKEKKFSLR